MNVRQIGPDRWKVTVIYQGQRWYFTWDNQDDAECCWADGIRDARAGKDPRERYRAASKTPEGLTLEAWSVTWLAAQDFDPRWREKVQGFLDRDILPRFGHIVLADGISRIEAKGWLSSLSTRKRAKTGKPLGPVSVRHIWGTFAQLVADAVAEGVLDRDPCAGLKPPKVPKGATRRHALTPAQVFALADEIARPRGKRTAPTSVQRRWWLLTVALAFTGCRWSELCGLRRLPDEVHLMRRPAAVTVVEPMKRRRGERYHGEPKSAAGARTVELPPALAELIAAHLTHGLPYVFGTSARTAPHYEHYRLALKAAATTLGYPEWGVHDLRHTHATWLRNCPRRAVQERLGHEPADVTDIYTHVTDEDRAEILRVLGAAWADGLVSRTPASAARR